MTKPSVMALTSPVLGPVHPDHERLVGAARRVLVEGIAHHGVRPPFTDEIWRAERAVVQQLEQYDDPSSDDHLYALEFQGPGCQYVMYGRTRNWRRRLSSHRQAAAPHGFALLNGWLSPGVRDAYPLEQIALAVTGHLHGQTHFRERFYNMRFEDGLCVAQAVFELGNHYLIRRQRPTGRELLMSLLSPISDAQRSPRFPGMSEVSARNTSPERSR